MERTYIKEILAGNASRFSYFVSKYKDMAYNIAWRITGNNEDAEEIVQDAFIKVYQSLKSFRHDSKFSTWLYKIVVNAALSKTRKPKQAFKEVEEQDLGAGHTAVETAYSALNAAEQKKYIGLALDELELEDKLLLTLYYLGENSIDEIHDITGISTDNIKMKLHRARKKMYALLHKKLKAEVHTLL
ncbi:MAG TPA: RNA polymerase sigma factor [Chitinophagales bacterium]|nr:RNA polymerase sigma factor [Chitinophagales bacterium]